MGELTAYLDGLPVPHAAALRRVVELALQEVPGAVEGPAVYGMPALKG